MNVRLRSFFAGAVGAVLAFGIVELVHGLYQLVPSVFVALAQGIVKLTPGSLVTQGIELLGTADIPVLIVCLVIGTLVVSALLAYLALRSPFLALVGVGVLAAIAILAAFSEPFVAPIATVITILVALSAGVTAAALLLRASGLQAPEPAPAESGGSGGGSRPWRACGLKRRTRRAASPWTAGTSSCSVAARRRPAWRRSGSAGCSPAAARRGRRPRSP